MNGIIPALFKFRHRNFKHELWRIFAAFECANENPACDRQKEGDPQNPAHDFKSPVHGWQGGIRQFGGLFMSVFTVSWTTLARRCRASTMEKRGRSRPGHS